MKTDPFLDRAGIQEGGRPVATVDELHKRLEQKVVKCGRQRALGFALLRASLPGLWKGSCAGFWREAAKTLGRAEGRKEAWKRRQIAGPAR